MGEVKGGEDEDEGERDVHFDGGGVGCCIEIGRGWRADSRAMEFK